MKKILILSLILSSIFLTSCSKSIEEQTYNGKDTIQKNELKLISNIDGISYILDNRDFYHFCSDGDIEVKELHYNILNTSFSNKGEEVIPNNLDIIGCKNSLLIYSSNDFKYIVNIVNSNEFDINTPNNRYEILLSKGNKYKDVYKSIDSNIYNAIDISGSKFYLNSKLNKIVDLKGVEYEDFGKTIKGKGLITGKTYNGKSVINFVGEYGKLMFGEKDNLNTWTNIKYENEDVILFNGNSGYYIVSKKDGNKVLKDDVKIEKILDNYFILKPYVYGGKKNIIYNSKINKIIDTINEDLIIGANNKYIIYQKNNLIYGINKESIIVELSNIQDLNLFEKPKLYLTNIDSGDSSEDFSKNTLIIGNFNKVLIEGKYKSNVYNFETKEFLLNEFKKDNIKINRFYYNNSINSAFIPVKINLGKEPGFMIYKSKGNFEYLPYDMVGKDYSKFKYKGENVITMFIKDGKTVPVFNGNYEKVIDCVNKVKIKDVEEIKWITKKTFNIFGGWSNKKVKDGTRIVKKESRICIDKKGNKITSF